MVCAVMLALSAAGCSQEDSGAESVSAEKSSVLSSSAEIDNVTYDTSVEAADLDTGYDNAFSTKISFTDDGAAIDGEGASADGTAVTVTAEGTYLLSGSCKNGRIIVDAGKDTEVKLVLDGLDLTCADNAAITALSGKKLTLTLADGSVNSLTDGAEYSLSDEDSNVDAALFSKADLTLNGSGSLTVKGNYKHGIVTKDELVIADGTITVDAASTGITGKDSVKILGGEITVTAGTNGIKSSNSEDGSLGFISVSGGRITVKSGGDGLQAETSLLIDGGEFDITTGGGSADAEPHQNDMGGFGGNNNKMNGGGMRGGFDRSDGNGSGAADNAAQGGFADRRGQRPDMQNGEQPQMPDGQRPEMQNGEQPQMPDGQQPNEQAVTSEDSSDSTSAKALKAGKAVSISGGSFVIDSADDSIHSDGTVTISGGSLTAASGDDGIHADDALLINGGETEITKSYEGLEAKTITISEGTTKVTASDDGVNASAGSSENSFGGFGGTSEGVFLKITGGTLYVNASGDGLDSNGEFRMEGGTVYVSGPVNAGNGALDYGEGCKATVTGGTLIACGAVGMEEGFDGSDSTQYSFLHNLSSTVSGGTELTVSDSSGSVLLSFTPEKDFQSVVFTAPALAGGETYTVTAGSVSETVTLGTDSMATSNSTLSGMGGGRGRGKIF